VFELNGERTREITAYDMMTKEKTIETRSLCLVAVHIVRNPYLMFKSAESATT
jgi:hypothetical protein